MGRPGIHLWAGVVLAVAAFAGAAGSHGSARVLSVCALGEALAIAWICRSWVLSNARAASPAVATAGETTSRDEAAVLLENVEAMLEHVPIALFRIAPSSASSSAAAPEVVPLNLSARRLLAPVHASPPGELAGLLASLPAGQRSLVSFNGEGGVERALAAVNEIVMPNGEFGRLLAFMPAESQLEAQTLNAWREMVHVLAHEIMNSLTPITSLSHTALDLMGDARAGSDTAERDLGVALSAIERRAESLSSFVTNYRNLSDVPPASLETVQLENEFARLQALLLPLWQAAGGSLRFEVEPASLELVIDPGQFEQALINLLKNSLEAAQPGRPPQALVQARLNRSGRLRIEVSDNGPGVPDEAIAHIFTPFYTTKLKGRGIGLAMVKRLLHGNGASVNYAKSVDQGARFVITF